MIRAGFDEAGLGPTLGPLVIGGFVTRRRGDEAPAGPLDDLLAPLAEAVGPPGTRDGRLEVGDSKKIHAGTRKLERIERTALATVAWVHGRVPRTVAELVALVCSQPGERPEDRRGVPWWASLDEALPVAGADPGSEAGRGRIEALGEGLRAAADAAGVEALWYGADLLSAARINRELGVEGERGGTKNTWATHAVLRLSAVALGSLLTEGEPGQPIEAVSLWCDKAGGRQAYADPMRRAFPMLAEAGSGPRVDPSTNLDLFGGAELHSDPYLRILDEARPRSHYRLGLPGLEQGGPLQRVDLGFVMGGDRLDPRISWASILAKYLRELILRAMNRHFAAKVAKLRPTAGYPEDAKRFIAEVEAALGEAGGLPRSKWIRSK